MRTQDYTDIIAALNSIVEIIAKKQDQALILFAASWCSDCSKAVPGINEAAKHLGTELFHVDVGTREQWKNNPEHPFKKEDSRLQLQGVPTLAFWKDGAIVDKIDQTLEDAPDAEAAKQLSLEFIGRFYS